MIEASSWGFLGSCLSIADVLAAMSLTWDAPGGDEVVLSKGHAAPALYSIAPENVFQPSTSAPGRYAARGSALQGHPRQGFAGVKVTSGSLGLAIPFALARVLANEDRGGRTLIVVGDGEVQSGIAMEALSLCAEYSPRGLIVLIDSNEAQALRAYHDTALRVAQSTFERAVSVDGHNLSDLLDLFGSARSDDEFKLVIARTRRGYGLNDRLFDGQPMAFIPSRDQVLSELESLRVLAHGGNYAAS